MVGDQHRRLSSDDICTVVAERQHELGFSLQLRIAGICGAFQAETCALLLWGLSKEHPVSHAWLKLPSELASLDASPLPRQSRY